MALQVADRVMESSASTGTGAFTLAGAYTGYRAFSAVCSTSDTAYYCIEALDASGNPSGDWEVGLGTYSGTNTLTRTTVHFSSNSNSAVSFSTGTKRVSLDATATHLALFAQKANNLSDLPSPATAWSNLGGDELAQDAIASMLAAGTHSGITVTYNDGSNSMSLAAVGGTVTSQTGTTYTAVLADANTYVQFSNASAITFTIPPNSSVAFPVGTVINMEQTGAGALSVAAGSGVTINSRSSDLTLAGQYAVAFVKKVATNTWTMNGDL